MVECTGYSDRFSRTLPDLPDISNRQPGLLPGTVRIACATEGSSKRRQVVSIRYMALPACSSHRLAPRAPFHTVLCVCVCLCLCLFSSSHPPYCSVASPRAVRGYMARRETGRGQRTEQGKSRAAQRSTQHCTALHSETAQHSTAQQAVYGVGPQ